MPEFRLKLLGVIIALCLHSTVLGCSSIAPGDVRGEKGGAGGDTATDGFAGKTSSNDTGGSANIGGSTTADAHQGGSGGTGGVDSSTGGSFGGTAGGGNPQCPSEPPFSDQDPQVVKTCMRPVFVATGNAVRRIVSYDYGATWTNGIEMPSGTDQNEHSLNEVAFGFGWVIAVGNGGVFRSADGKTWTTIPGAPTAASGVAFGGGRLIIVTPDNAYWSVDGNVWTKQGYKKWTNHLHGVAYGNGAFVTVGDDSTSAASSDGGLSWKSSKLANLGGWMRDVAFGNGVFVAVGTSPSGLRATSTDGLQWNSVASGQFDFEGLAFDGQTFHSGGRLPATTTDGGSWTSIKASRFIGDLAFHEGNFVGVADTVIYRSPDAKNWTQVYRGGTSPLVTVAVGYLGNINAQ